MADTHHAQGPGKSVLGIGQRIVSIMVEMVETRLRLAVVELEEEKANLFQLLLMLGLTMLFAAFGLMSLMVLIIWAVDPAISPECDDCHHRGVAATGTDWRHLDVT